MIIDFRGNTGGSGSGGTSNYNELSNKPQVNGVSLQGNKTTSQLGISATTNYNELQNMPQINGVTLSGNVSSDTLGISGGTTDYNDLDNMPQINGVTLSGNVTSEQLGISGYTLPAASQNTLGGVKVGSGLSIDSGGTLSASGGGGGMSPHWFNYSDERFCLVREDCTNDGDYLCHFGAEIEGSRSFRGVQCVGGAINTDYTGYGMQPVGNGHMTGTVTDANGVTYWAHAWTENGKLYWEVNSPIMDLDAYGTGSNKEGCLVY